MKLYKNLIQSSADTLKEIFSNHRYADKSIEHLFKKNPQWGSRDRKFVAETIYDVVRNFRLLAEITGNDKNYWYMIGVLLVIKGVEIPEWQEFKHLNPQEVLSLKTQLSINPAISESYPDWLWKKGELELGKDTWLNEAAQLNKQAKVVLRMNTLKTDHSTFLSKMVAENLELNKISEGENAYELAVRKNVFSSKLFKEGWFEVQDLGSQRIGEFANPKPGELVIDACAGAGGKSLHLAALMKNKGKIISMDVEQWKLNECKKRASRAGAFNIETKLIEENKTINNYKGKADLLLLDVPCSGTGVIKRNPDTKWKLSENKLNELLNLQQQLMNEYASMLKQNGRLIYSTCSIFPSENKTQVENFLKTNSEFSFIKDETILPSRGYDGFYMCEILKN
ncbi:MAG: RsmB/NOP family class I SAM-dependent RNA methyltransferase [Sphingobacteriaceae bacterium]|nr:RsmB/NOP family class I SAM-dependent RNA methyltransferase [Sphingobacteriaceae bacterium]